MGIQLPTRERGLAVATGVMTVGMMATRRLAKPSEVEDVHVEFWAGVQEMGTLAWQKVSEVLRTSLNRSGFPQPSADLMQQSYGEMVRPPLIVVAPGIAVRATEYDERYSSIDLDHYRERMSPEMFRAFVRHIGSIKSRPGLDIGKCGDTLQI